MTSDLRSLHVRVKRLENHLASLPESNTCIYERVQVAHTKMREVVPDELHAAYEVMQLLGNTLFETTDVKALVQEWQDARHALSEFDALRDCLDRPLASGDEAKLGELMQRVKEVRAVLKREDRAVDRLLVALDTGTARINDRLLRISRDVLRVEDEAVRSKRT